MNLSERTSPESNSRAKGTQRSPLTEPLRASENLNFRGIMDILLTTTGDLDLTNNLLTLVDTLEVQVRQRLEIKLYTNQGEWGFNLDFGLPWITEGDNIQLISKADKGYVDATIKQAILSQEDVEEIVDYYSTLDPALRINTISCNVRVTSGEIITFQLEG